jgi:hypothetical protein
MNEQVREALSALRDLIDQSLDGGAGAKPGDSQAKPPSATDPAMAEDRTVTIEDVSITVPADGSPTYYAKPNGGHAHIVVALDSEGKKLKTLEYVKKNSTRADITPKDFLKRWKNELEGKAVRHLEPPSTGADQPNVSIS